MADQILFLTELLGLKVYDLKGRKLGVVKDAAIVPLVDPVRVDRFLLSGDGTLNAFWRWRRQPSRSFMGRISASGSIASRSSTTICAPRWPGRSKGSV